MKTILAILMPVMLLSCSSTPLAASKEAPMSLSITSTAFAAGQPIPPLYSCRGKNISPPLAWSGAPATTKSFGLILDDPDAPSGTYVHWVIYNIPAASKGLPESVPGSVKLGDGSLQGTNSSGGTGYTGPCPPSGTHHYHFKVYALDAVLSLSSGATKEQLLAAMQGHILAQGELVGTFSK